MRNLFLIAALSALSACSSVTQTKPEQAVFHPEFSNSDLNYVISSLLKFVEKSESTDKFSAKSFIKENGGLLNKEINVILPDDSTIRIKILSQGYFLISGYETLSEPFLRIEKYKEKYSISIGPRGGVGSYAEFSVSEEDGTVTDGGVLIACP
jgi:hypothetical protein